MTQMRLAAIAVNLGAFHEQGSVCLFPDVIALDTVNRLIKAWPSSAAFKFVGLVENLHPAADTFIDTRFFGKVVMRARAFSAVLARDLEGQWVQLFFPFSVRFRDLFHLLSLGAIALPLNLITQA